jgi:hypothetical protein
MKMLKLKTLGLPLNLTTPDKGTTQDLLKIVVNNVPQGGISADEMRKRIRLLDKIDEIKGGELLLLEDAIAEELQRLTAIMRWNVIDKSILEFCDDVEHMAEPPKEEKKD